MIILKLQGGMGNQMFQYAFARSLQEKIKQNRIMLDISDFKYDILRNYSLKHFTLNDTVIIDDTGRYNKFYDQRVNPILKIGTKFCPNFQYMIFSIFSIYLWDYAKYKEIKIIRQSKNIMLHGLWQSGAYFDEISSIIADEFSVRGEALYENQLLIDSIKNCNAVCVHVRRGDFLSTANKLSNCTNQYYEEAMKYIDTHVVYPIYFIFSDDIADVMKHFSFGQRQVFFVEKNNPDYEELRLMYNCKHFIIANSTFSWWASYLAKNSNKIIVAPETWYNDGRDTTYLMRKDWVVMENV